MKKITKLISFILSVIMALQAMNLSAVWADVKIDGATDEVVSGIAVDVDDYGISTFAENSEESDENTLQDIVLVLDVSGSMSGDKINNLKTASKKFCESVLSSNANNRIGMVTFDNDKVYGFTSNYDELSENIDSMEAWYGTHVANSLNLADELFKDLYATENERNSVKSIVIMSDGEISDKSSTTKVYNNIKDNYNIYSVYLGTSVSAKSYMESIQNSGFFNAEDVDSLIEQFGKIADIILNPLEINFSKALKVEKDENGNIISDGTIKINEDGTYEYVYTYEVTAYLTNRNTEDITNATVTINLGENMNLASGESLQKYFSVIPNDGTSVKCTWTIEVYYGSLMSSKTIEYSIEVEADRLSLYTYKDDIYVETITLEDNRLDLNNDIWSFDNYTINSSHDVLTNSQIESVLYGLNNAYKAYLSDNMKKKQNGQCYGMSVTVLLNKIGKISLKDINIANEDLYSLTKNDGGVMGWINFYHLTQLLPCYESFKQSFMKSGEQNLIPTYDLAKMFRFKTQLDKEHVELLEKSVAACSSGEAPVLIDFAFDQGAHAIVGYDVEYGSYLKCGKTYNARIITYDCNLTESNNNVLREDSYVYFNSGTNQWCIPNYSDESKLGYTGANNEDGFFKGISNDVNMLDTNNFSNKTALYEQNILRVNNINKLNNIQVNNNFLKEEGRLNKYLVGSFDTGILPGYTDNQAYSVILNNEEKYTVQYIDEAEIDVSMMYENYYEKIISSAGKGANFEQNGSISIIENNGNYTLGLTANDGYTVLPWYTVEVYGTKEAKNPILTITEDGYIFEGEELTNIKVIANNDDETKELTFDSDKTSVLITNDNDSLVVKEDTDNDGIYDRIIADSDNQVTETTTKPKNYGGGGAGSSSLKVINYNETGSEETTEITTEATTEDENKGTDFTQVKVTIGSNVITINDKEYEMEAAPYIQAESNSTLVPLRFVALAIAGGDVENADSSNSIIWDADTKTATIVFNGSTIKFTAGSDTMIVDGKSKTIDNSVKAEIKDGRMYIPFRALGEALGADVEWDAETRTAIYNINN